MSPKLLHNLSERIRSGPDGSHTSRGGILRALCVVAGWMIFLVGTAEAARAVNTVSNLVVKGKGANTVIQVDTARTPLFTVYKREKPPRLTVDIRNCKKRGIHGLTDVEGGVVSQVATTQFKNRGSYVTRLMVNLRWDSRYSVRVKGKRLLVTLFSGKDKEPVPAATSQAPSGREASLTRELDQARLELKRQRAINKAAVEAATKLRQAALAARSKLTRISRDDARRKRLVARLKQTRRKLAQAEKARAAASKKSRNLEQKLGRGAAGAAPRGKINDIRFVDGKHSAKVVIDLEGRPWHRVTSTSGEPTLTLSRTRLPKLLQRTLDTREFNGPIKRVVSYVKDPSSDLVVIKVATKAGGSHRIHRQGSTLVWEFDKTNARLASKSGPAARLNNGYAYRTTRVAAARSKRRRGRARRRYVGRRIDLDFKDADLHNILRLLSEVGNVNIVTSDKVRGRVTIRMRNVPWDQALDVILKAKNMGQVREGNLVRVAPRVDLEKERESEIARMKQMALLRPLETRLIPLSYAQASKVLSKIRYMLSPRGKLTHDERTNMVIARDLAGNLDLMERLIKNLDTQTPQVLIEARIVEARTNFTRELGIQWGGGFTASSAGGNSTGLVFPNQIGIGGGAMDGQTPVGGILLGQASNPNFAVNLPAATGTGAGGALGLTLGSISGNFNINLRLSAAEYSGDIRIVSAPKITTMDNVEAKIEQGVTIPFSQVSANGVQTTFKDAKLNLTVKPHVTADGSIIMKVGITNNEPDFVNTGPRGEPTILKKEAKTELMVKDGDTTVIGGIYTIRTGRSWAKVPWLAEIPILGFFFRYKKDTSDRQEVLVFITPRIINRAQSIGS